MEAVIFILVVVLGYGFVAFFGAPYVPAKTRDVELALDKLYKLRRSDVLLDMGCGDGKVLRAASRRGARAVGYELHPLLVVISWWLSRRDSRVTVQLANMWRRPFPDDTTVVYVFGDSRDIGKIRDRIRAEATRLGRRLHVISYGFRLPGLEPVSEVAAHFLFTVEPLQPGQPQV